MLPLFYWCFLPTLEQIDGIITASSWSVFSEPHPTLCCGCMLIEENKMEILQQPVGIGHWPFLFTQSETTFLSGGPKCSHGGKATDLVHLLDKETGRRLLTESWMGIFVVFTSGIQAAPDVSTISKSMKTLNSHLKTASSYLCLTHITGATLHSELL